MPVRRRRTPLVALVALAVLCGACSLERSGYQFVRNRSTGTYLKVPSEWTVYDQKDIDDLVATQEGASEESPERYPFLSIFDAEPNAELDFDIAADRPVGIVRVRDLSPEERDSVSFASARDDLYPLNEGLQSGALPVKRSIEISQDSADGQRIVFSFRDDETGDTSTIDQTTLVDRDKNRLYLLVVACRSRCYERHSKQIETVVTSLTIKET